MRVLRAAVVLAGAMLLSGHVGSPNVFFSGKAGPYDVRVVVRPPEVVPGVARVTVRTLEDVQRVSIRPVYWRAGSRGAPSADETRRLEGDARTFEGSLWLMQQGAYTVDVIVEGARGTANVLVPVASVATGQLEMSTPLAALLAVLGLTLCAGLVTIVYKAAGESLVPIEATVDAARRRRARRVAALSIPIIGVMVFGGARWWQAVDREYAEDIYRPSPLVVHRDASSLSVALSDTVFQPGRVISALVPDHGKMMHMFLVRERDARAFAHLHPVPADSGPVPRFTAALPALPEGKYHAFADVVHETGFERTLVGTVDLSAPPPGAPASDPDDAWFVGDAASGGVARLQDGSTIRMRVDPPGAIESGRELSLRFDVSDAAGQPARLEPYLGMAAHAVVVRPDGSVYVHLHPMGTVSTAARQLFDARDRGDTTQSGRVRIADHSMHVAPPDTMSASVEFPYAFPRAGDYRVFVQVKRGGRVQTGAFAVTVAEPTPGR